MNCTRSEMKVSRGYYSMAPITKDVKGFYGNQRAFACPNPGDCLGNNLCAGLKTGALCATCQCTSWEECWTTIPGLGPMCRKCVNSAGRTALIIMGIPITVVSLYIGIRLMDRGSTKLKDLTS